MIKQPKKRDVLIVIISAALLTLALRLSLIAYPPTTDEGCYVFHALMSQQSEVMLPSAPINLYASIAAVVGYDEARPLLRFRLFDAVIATGTSILLGIFLLRWVRFWPALIATLAWAVLTCNPLFIDGGFKNPITAAMLVLLATLLLVTSKNYKYCFIAGLLIPLAVLLREAFLFVPFATTVMCLLVHRKRGSLLHIGGGLCSTGIVLVWLSLTHGSPLSIVHYYMDLSHVTGDRLAELAGYKFSSIRRDSFDATLKAVRWFIVFLILGCISLAWMKRRRALPYLLSLLLIVAFLPEIYGKSCYPYHWAQLSLGLVIFAALGLHYVLLYCKVKRFRPSWVYSLCFIWIAIVGKSTAINYSDAWKLSSEFAPLTLHGDWDDPVVHRSFYTQTAKYLRENTTKDDRVLTSGFYFLLYPLSNRQPPDPEFADITFSTLAEHHLKRQDLIKKLKTERPTIVIQSLRWQVPLEEIWPDFEKHYVLEKTFPVNHHQHYGLFGAKIWHRRE